MQFSNRMIVYLTKLFFLHGGKSPRLLATAKTTEQKQQHVGLCHV